MPRARATLGETRIFLPVMTKCSDRPLATQNGSKAALTKSSSPATSQFSRVHRSGDRERRARERERARHEGSPDHFGICRTSQCLPDNRLHCCKSIFYAVVQLIDEHPGLGLFLLVIGKIDEGGEILNDIAALVSHRTDKNC